MRAGRDVIFQATFFDGRWRGHADFLLRVDRPSDLGDWSYEVADTKLARRVKAAALLQMCSYADRLEQLQGVAPETMYVVTGDGVRHPHRIADYAAYYRSIKAGFEARVFGDAPAADHVSGSGRALQGLPLVRRLRGQASGGRPPVARGRDHPGPAWPPRRGRGADAARPRRRARQVRRSRRSASRPSRRSANQARHPAGRRGGRSGPASS